MMMADRGRPRSFDRTQALARAMELFWEKGYDATSLADLTAAMRIASPSLYAAFGSKEALFREAVELYEATEGAELWGPVAAAPTAYAAAERFLMGTARIFSRPDKPCGCLIVLSALHAGDTSPAVRSELARRRALTTKALADCFAKGIATGEVPAGADLHSIAAYLVTVQQGMSIQARDGATQAQLEDIARAALAAWQPLLEAAPRSAA